MKKLFFAACIIAVTSSVLMVSCEKEPGPVSNNTNTVNCADSAYLFADSIGCNNIRLFQVLSNNARIAVAKGNNPLIDTVTKGGFFYITYDSIAGTTACNGAIYKNATISCSKRK
ncbi:MAG: hypothetical protein MUE72_06430 [Chitinophagaceae bacterium]|jgi:hypothetical protein|nr:hypothetical protein [Chitinophagaceae bacterium]